MSRIFVDSNIFIYHFEHPGTLGNRATYILDRISYRGDELFTSALALGEVLVKPIQLGNRILEAKYRSLLSGPEVNLAPFDAVAGEIFARVRQDRRIKTPDAIHLATAATGLRQRLFPAFNSLFPWIARRSKLAQMLQGKSPRNVGTLSPIPTRMKS
jgi:predicted nucleic acid-binding protein